jgi:hypothetical protein
MQHITTLAEAASGNSLGYPTFVTGLIALAIFGLLAVVTWSYRDVANRHDHKAGNDSHH